MCGCAGVCTHAYVTQTHTHTSSMHTNKMIHTPQCYGGIAQYSKVHREADMRQITIEMCVCV
jgi:hypothetical protein